MKAAIYCRVSTENQEVEGTSLQTQLDACIKKAHEVGYEVPEEYQLREARSGLNLDRPCLSKLRELVKHGQVEAIIAYSTDRLARDGLHLLLLVDEIEKAGAKVVFVTEPHQNTPEGQLLTYVRGWASKLEALKIKERTVRGRKERAKRGMLPTRGDLYGYLYLSGKGESRGIRIPDQDKAKVVVNIFNWYAQDGLTLEAMRKRLYAEGIVSPTGNATWSRATLLRLLGNRGYVGETISKWMSHDEAITVNGATPALVSIDTFEATQERLHFNKQNSLRNTKRFYPLRGMVFCGACGGRMTGAAFSGGRRYRCWRYEWAGSEKHRCKTSVLAEPLERGVQEIVQHLLSNPDLVEAQVKRYHDNSGQSDLKAHLEAIGNHLAALARGEESIARMLRQGVLEEHIAQAQLKEGRLEREALKRERSQLRGRLESAQSWERLDLEVLCHRALANLQAPTPDLQRLALEALGARVSINRDGARVSLALPVEDTSDSAFVLQTS